MQTTEDPQEPPEEPFGEAVASKVSFPIHSSDSTSLKWQAGFTERSSSQPLKGKEFNDLILEKVSCHSWTWFGNVVH